VPDWWFNVTAGTLMCWSVLQNVLEVPAGTSNPNQSAKYELEVPAGTSNPNQSAGQYFEFLKNVFNFFFFVFIRLFKVFQLFMINTRYNSDLLNSFKIFELIYFN
jgi:hypothetical protein